MGGFGSTSNVQPNAYEETISEELKEDIRKAIFESKGASHD